MENLRQVLYNFHRNGGGQPNQTSAPNNIHQSPQQHHHHQIQMPLLSSRSCSSTATPTAAAVAGCNPMVVNHSAGHNTSATKPPGLQHNGIIIVPNNASASGSSIIDVQQNPISISVPATSQLSQQHLAKTLQQQQHQFNNQHHHINSVSPLNHSLTTLEHPLTLGGDEGAAVATFGAAGIEGPLCTTNSNADAASAANKSSDDSADCQG